MLGVKKAIYYFGEIEVFFRARFIYQWRSIQMNEKWFFYVAIFPFLLKEIPIFEERTVYN